MDIGNVEQNSGEHKQEHSNQKQEHRGEQEREQPLCQPCGGFDGQWDIDALGKAKIAKAAKDASATIADAGDTFRVNVTLGMYRGNKLQWDIITR